MNVNTWTNEENLEHRGEEVEYQPSTPAHNHYKGNKTYNKQCSIVYFDQSIPADSFRRRIKLISLRANSNIHIYIYMCIFYIVSIV